MSRTWILPVLLWATAALLSPRLRPHDYAGGRSRDEAERVLANRSALALMLGEFRTSISDMMYIKTERYLHGGVAYVPHLMEQVLTVEGIGAAAEHEHEEEHSGHAQDSGEEHFHCAGGVDTVIPEAARDYRGWIGRMQRQVKPWRDPSLPHVHGDGDELIPWFRMMTLSDPRYTRGYTVGAFWIQQHNPDAALAFVEEGLRHNPRAFELHLAKGFLLVRQARRLGEQGEGLPLLRKARDAFLSAAEFMAEVRPRHVEGPIEEAPGWSTYQENDARAATLMAVLLEERVGDPQRARELALQYLHLLPDHDKLRAFIEGTP